MSDASVLIDCLIEAGDWPAPDELQLLADGAVGAAIAVLMRMAVAVVDDLRGKGHLHTVAESRRTIAAVSVAFQRQRHRIGG